jgi:thiamine kinase
VAPDVARSHAAHVIPDHVLAHVPGAGRGDSTRVTRLHGGTVNAIFRVDTRAGQFVARVHDPVARRLGADHEREARLHGVAAAAGLAPALVHVDDAFEFMVMEYVPGPVWTAQHFAQAEHVARLGALLRTLHELTAPTVAPFDVPAILRRYYDRLSEALPQERAWFAELLHRGEQALLACGTLHRPKTVVHNDLYHANIIGTERLWLLDWEYAAVADPVFDLASILAYHPQAAPHTDLLLDASGLREVVSADMLRHATWLWVLVGYLWYRSHRLDDPDPNPATLAAEHALRERLDLRP